jgi:hypothetical protein
MQLFDRKVMHNLVVLEHVQDIILGINFIHQHALNSNLLMDKCYWETPPISSGQLKEAERTHIDALCSRKIKLKCLNEENKSIGINNTMMATIDTPTASSLDHQELSNSTMKLSHTQSYKTALPT